MDIKRIVVGDLQVNCYLLSTEQGTVAIDPGDDYERICAYGKKITAVLLTHGHFDHTGAVERLRKDGAQVYIAKEDECMLSDGYLSLATPFGFPFNKTGADAIVEDGDSFVLCGMNVTVIKTPGHTAGSVCYLIDGILFSGDTLFAQSIGRCDFPGGDFNTIEKSIKEKIYTLPEDTVVYSGHGEATTVKNEKLYNPYVR